jgi:hypothetical protein
MKINGIFFIALLILLITAGCLSDEKTSEAELPKLNDGSTIFIEDSLVTPPANVPADADTSSLLVGVWKIQTGNQEELYWQFHDDGNLTGGSEPDSHQVSGEWSSIGFENLVTIHAVGANSNGEMIAYDIELVTDLSNRTISIVNPDEDSHWIFIKQS